MLNVVCPNCQYGMKLAKPKTGKFTPSCKNCGQKFKLLIKEQSDKSFRYKTAALEKQTPQSQLSNEETRLEQAQNSAANSGDSVSSSGTAVKKVLRSVSVESTTGATGTPNAPKPSVTSANSATQQGKSRNGQTVASTTNPASRSPSKAGSLGPYRLIKLLGEGGMGSVYLANQTTLDRNVALKVVRSKLANNPQMLARFTREAYAAAQLIHPNVVQIYDMGNDNGNSFFSMELVDGQSLHEIVGEKKRLDPEQAASYILHAARGLQCAHNAGMVHRDIKPANLLVNREGLVKVADLGLVKVPDRDEVEDDNASELIAASAAQDITTVGATIGTPYYMAPEQAKTSAVDHRADIYSLGCTFYVLLTGKRPFEGRSFQELVSKHSNEAIVLPSRVVERVPGELSAIVSQMMAKKPEDRYQSAGELIADLESFLGVKPAASFTPDEKDAETIESACAEFNTASTSKIRGVLPLTLVVGSLLAAILTFFVSWKLATGFLLMPMFAIATWFVVSGLNHSTTLFDQTRELVVRSGIFAWMKWLFAGLLLVAASFLIGTFPHWLLLAVLGVGLGVGYHYLIEVPLQKARQQSIAKAESLVRKMRIKGMEEATIQTFVAKYSPKHWEEFFESIFGYSAKRRVREELARSETGKKKPKFRAWRDGVYDSLNRRIEMLDEEADRRHLRNVEQAGLVAEGISAADAKSQAMQMANAIVDHGDSIRVAQLEKRLREVDPVFQRQQQRQKIKAMLKEARSGQYQNAPNAFSQISVWLDRFLGSYARLLLGCCLIVGCLLWARQNDLLVSVDQLKDLSQQGASALQETVSTGQAGEAAAAATESAKLQGQNMLASAAKPTTSFLGIFRSFNSLIAGLILVFSTIVFGWRMSLFAIPAAIVAMFGASFGIPDLIPFDVPHLNKLAAAIAIGLFLLGIVFGRREA